MKVGGWFIFASFGPARKVGRNEDPIGFRQVQGQGLLPIRPAQSFSGACSVEGKFRRQEMSSYRVQKKCADCPFASSGPGLVLRKSLRPGRWREILTGLLRQEHFVCHKTSDETGNGTNLICAGSIEWQEKRGISSQWLRIAERLDSFRKSA
jgi:hypothetical protein